MGQTWRINGQVYNLHQLRELKKQGLDPRKDDVVMKFVTPTADGSTVGDATNCDKEKAVAEKAAKNEKKAKVKAEVEAKVKADAKELKEEPTDDGSLEEEATPEPVVNYDDMDFFTLKKTASEAGMEVTNKTKKDEVLAFLSTK